MLAKGKKRPCCFDRSGMYSKSLAAPPMILKYEQNSNSKLS